MSVAYIIAYHGISYHLANHDLAAWEKQHRTDLCAGLCRLNCQLGCIAGLTLVGSGDIAYTNFEAFGLIKHVTPSWKYNLILALCSTEKTIPPICHQLSLTRNVCHSYIHTNVVNPIQCHKPSPKSHEFLVAGVFTHPQKVGLWHWIYRTKSQALWQSSVCPGQNRSMRARLEHRPRGIEVGRWSSSASGAIVMGSAKIRTISIEKMMNHIFAIYLPYFVYSMRKAVVKGLQRWLPAAKRCLVYAKLRWGMFFRILIFFWRLHVPYELLQAMN